MAGTTSTQTPVRVFEIDTGTELIWGQKQSDSYRLLHVLLKQRLRRRGDAPPSATTSTSCAES